MTRPLRIQFPGAFYHITSRGNERQPIFLSIGVKKKFFEYLQAGHERFGVIIHAYCLMGNHFHLIVETPLGNLSQFMHFINGSFAAYTNILHQRSGHLLQGRYSSILVEAKAYAQELSRYIHLNPVRAKIVKKPEDYQWSIFQEYIGARTIPKWLMTEIILGYFAETPSLARKKYYCFVLERVDSEHANPLEDVFASSILGSKEFIARIKEKYLDGKARDRDLPQLIGFRDRPSPEMIREQAAKAIGPNVRLGKKVCIYLCRQHAGMSLKQISVLFGLSESGVSQVYRRMSMEILEDKKRAYLVKTIEDKIFCQMCRSDPIRGG
jgi:putative transposase